MLDPKPTTINIKNTNIYTKVALLVDREDFRQIANKIRQKIGLKNPYDYKLINDYNFEQEQDELGKTMTIKDDASPKYQAFRHIVLSIINLPKIFRKYNLHPEQYRIVLMTILCNYVRDGDFGADTYYLLGKEIKNLQTEFQTGDNNMGILVVYPSTTRKELLNEFSQYKSKLKMLNTIPNIRRNRKWYWMKKSGLSYNEIHSKITLKGERITKDGVVKAIQHYKDKLEQ